MTMTLQVLPLPQIKQAQFCFADALAFQAHLEVLKSLHQSLHVGVAGYSYRSGQLAKSDAPVAEFAAATSLDFRGALCRRLSKFKLFHRLPSHQTSGDQYAAQIVTLFAVTQ